ncbi:MAG: sulfur carrier protein ThiS [Phycisphaerales bacterium]|nr:sulfur carrier protein ThiS [Phycisphaerales bacterium]MCI0632070.1 sulfur carrier protein ThiS [Phycisphaerales bacterium]MCI0675561.1 sulfur carrier protein ThiS [Phycisphaerales bacterium]
MNVQINGELVALQDDCNVRQLLENRGLGAAACAVEVNQELVPKRRHQEHVLAEGDYIEIVTLVGGG